jgi:hypothetical protein
MLFSGQALRIGVITVSYSMLERRSALPHTHLPDPGAVRPDACSTLIRFTIVLSVATSWD